MDIRGSREKTGITQEEMARRLGVSNKTISAWEVGRRNPKSTMLPKIAEVLGCSIMELFGEEAV